ncbi:MAG: hypothetical protein H6Q67_1645 [Firmicutes bacterium]|nr:hypothetical protein [Bacillota bacterium]
MDKNICSVTPTLYFACSGGSNVGQIANDACRELTRDGEGKLYCLAAIGGHITSFAESAKTSNVVIAVDGCGVKCALKVLEEANVPVTHHVVLTDWGIEKNKELFPDAVVVQAVKDKIMALSKQQG